MTGEASDLRQSQPVSVEGDDLIQPRGLASHSHLHRANLTADGPSSAEGCDGNPRQPTSEPKRTYVDHGLTGTNRARPGLREALAACRAGDTLVVTKLDRLARSVHDPTDPVGRLLFNALAMIAEFEADLARLRTREGMKVARAKGRVRGKQPKLSPRQQAHLVALHQAREHTIGELEELFSVTRSTVYRAPRPRSSRALSPDARRTRALRWRWLHRMDLLPQQTGQQLTVVGDRIGQPDQVRQDGAE
ncbi:MAG: recombinase family protein [Pseudonocardiaceae bacterium]